MTSKASFAMTLAALSFIFIAGILSMFTAYTMKGSVNNFKYKAPMMDKMSKADSEESMQQDN